MKGPGRADETSTESEKKQQKICCGNLTLPPLNFLKAGPVTKNFRAL